VRGQILAQVALFSIGRQQRGTMMRPVLNGILACAMMVGLAQLGTASALTLKTLRFVRVARMETFHRI
jgi:hypothetical protein